MIPKQPRITFRSPINRITAFTLAAGALLTGCAGVSPQRIAERKIEAALPRVLGPAQKYDVHVAGDAFALSRGRAKRVQISGDQVQLTSALTMDTLNIDAADLVFDAKTRTMQSAGPIDFRGSLGQTNLSRYLALTKGPASSLQVTLHDSDLEAAVPVTALGLRTTAHLSGNFAPHPGAADQLDFHADGARLGVVPLPPALLNAALDRMNPLLDLSGMKIPLTVTSATVEHGVVSVHGTAKIPER